MVEDPRTLFLEIAHRVVWCTLATVDRRDRPRSRLVHPVWQREDERLVGYVVTRPTPLKRAHLAHSPFASCSYWDPAHDVAVAECAARWVDDAAERAAAWAAVSGPEPPLGFDPYAIVPGGPDDPAGAVLRLDPWRLRAARAADLAQGRPALVWRLDDAQPARVADRR